MNIYKTFFLFSLFLLPTYAWANSNSISCPGIVHSVMIEVGNDKPAPDIIIPDVGAEGETPQHEWNYLNNRPANVIITAHCFYPADPTKKYNKRTNKKVVDIKIPFGIKKCTLEENKRFHCE